MRGVNKQATHMHTLYNTAYTYARTHSTRNSDWGDEDAQREGEVE